MGRLDKKVAMITGGSLGIGEGTAKLFAKEGAKVVIADINEKEGNRVVDEIKKDGGEAFYVQLDVSKEDQWEDAMAKTLDKYGKLNVLVNNAGISLGYTVEQTSLEDWNAIMDVNSTGVFLGVKHAIRVMKDNGEDNSIINRSSIDGMVGESDLFAYCASKGSVSILTKSAALHVGEQGYRIRINSVHPGYVHSALSEKEAADSGLSNEEYFENVAALHPIGFIAEPIDIAYADLYLASDESRFVTGSGLVIDGGWTAQ